MSSNTAELIHKSQLGDREARDELFRRVEGEMKSIAGRFLRDERPHHTLQPTALVDEAFMKLVGQEHAAYNNRNHFVRVAIVAMRQILIDSARASQAEKRPDDMKRQELDPSWVGDPDVRHPIDSEAFSSALERLQDRSPAVVEVFGLRCWGRMTTEEAADVLGLTASTVRKHWATAQAFLNAALLENPAP